MQNLITIDMGVADIYALLRARNIMMKYLLVLHFAIYHHPKHIWKAKLLPQHITCNVYWYHLCAEGYNDFNIVLQTFPI